MTHAPGDESRLLIVEQSGRIKVLRNGQLLATPFLDIDMISRCCGERGLLGLAFHPAYTDNGLFYVNYTDNAGDTIVARYCVSVDPDVADPDTALVVLRIVQPDINHNGGWMSFGPDGYLYIATGDGGEHYDPENRAQDTTDQLLGKLLRIDVDRDDWPSLPDRNYAIPPDNPFVGLAGDDEIWAYGLRHPWRCAFDDATGDLYIADVGEGDWEEINFQVASGAGGENYGWPCLEASECLERADCPCSAPPLTMPIYEYAHGGDPARCSITGGEVYRGCAIAGLRGTYFFADFCSAEIWSFRVDGVVTDFQDRTAALDPGNRLDIRAPSSFGRDALGELYICDYEDGEVFKIVAVAAPFPVSIAASEPPDAAIDARQPAEPDGAHPAGWQTISLTFDGPVSCLTPDDFTVAQNGGSNPPPVVQEVEPLSAQTVRVHLSDRIAIRAWTTLTHAESGTQIRLGYLPADVNGDATSGVPDVLTLIDVLSGIAGPLPPWSTDVDRSGATMPGDILRVIDLLNGALAYDVYDGASLP